MMLRRLWNVPHQSVNETYYFSYIDMMIWSRSIDLSSPVRQGPFFVCGMKGSAPGKALRAPTALMLFQWHLSPAGLLSPRAGGYPSSGNHRLAVSSSRLAPLRQGKDGFAKLFQELMLFVITIRGEKKKRTFTVTWVSISERRAIFLSAMHQQVYPKELNLLLAG